MALDRAISVLYWRFFGSVLALRRRYNGDSAVVSRIVRLIVRSLLRNRTAEPSELHSLGCKTNLSTFVSEQSLPQFIIVVVVTLQSSRIDSNSVRQTQVV